jgi:phospholipid-binding lipoprotein MlaA
MTQTLKRLLAAAILGVAFCLPAHAADGDVSDPLESVNRAVFWFNDHLDQYLIEPIAKGYHWAMPQYGQDRVHHVITNLDEPLSTVNYLLQGNLDQSSQSLFRFLFNSTFGLAGLYDITGEQSGDKATGFGDTFARWGVPSGPYLVLPLIGPNDVRGTVGLAGDYYGDPVSWFVWSDSTQIRDPDTVLDIKDGVKLLDERTRLLSGIDDMRKNSLDFYSTARSIYLQRQAAKLGDTGEASADTPDYK